MRLLSLTIRNYRVHKDVTVTFDPSRNLIGGANESGKSTLAEAAHRALFLRAKTGGSVQKEMVSQTHLGDPEVVLNFEAAETSWELEKRFAGTSKGSTRLTPSGGATLRDDEAETKLTEILGTEGASGRGAANQLPSLWAHLWVWQGKSGDDPSLHASTHKDTLVQRLQKDGIAAVMQSAADQLAAEKITESYLELFTTTGRPKSGSKPELALARLTQAETNLKKTKEAASRLEQAVTDYTRAEKDIAEADSVLPSLREQRTLADKNLLEVSDLKKEEEIRLRALEATATRHTQLTRDDEKIHILKTQVTNSQKNLAPAEEELEKFITTETSTRIASQTAEAALRKSSDSLRKSRLLNDLTTAIVSSFEKSETHNLLLERSQKAKTIRSELATIRASLSPLPILSSTDLTRLRKLDRDYSQAQATLDAMATGIELIETSETATLDGKKLIPGEPHILTDAGELSIGSGTRLRIRPGGGSSLAEARSNAEKFAHAITSALASLTVRDLEHATRVLEQRQTFEQRIERREESLTALGGEKLSQELTHAAQELETINAEVNRRTAQLEDIPKPSNLAEARQQLTSRRDTLSSAETEEATAQKSISQIRKRNEAAARALQTHREKISTARDSLRDQETSIKVLEETHGNTDARSQAITKAKQAENEATASLAAIRKSLSELAPEILSADLQRFTRAIAQQEAKHREASDQLLIARDRLTLDGTTDPEADLRYALARCEAAREEHTSEHRRAQAIEKLHLLFSSSREAIDRSLVEPLAERINGYLQCLFGKGTEIRVKLNDSGIEGMEILRPGASAFEFSTLSGGAKEQVAAASRLALAEILAADHDGCLPILFDDAFAYTDPERTQSLQRMLDLAATRGLQVIVLTCTPGDYSGFGAMERGL